MKFDGIAGVDMLAHGSRAFPYDIRLDDDCHYRKYASYVSRLLSFHIYGEIDSRFRSVDFAKAGLFRTGEADECACFQCGNLICVWEYDDDPFEQHAKCSLNCPFVERERTKKKMRMAEASVGDELRKFADFFYAGRSEKWQNRQKNLEPSFEPKICVCLITGGCSRTLEQMMADNLDGQNDNVRKHQTDTSPWNAVSGSAKKQSVFDYADEVVLPSRTYMGMVKFRDRPDLTMSPGRAMMGDTSAQNRSSLKPIIPPESSNQGDGYFIADCFEDWLFYHNGLRKKNDNLDGQNGNFGKRQTEKSPRNAATGSAQEESGFYMYYENVEKVVDYLHRQMRVKDVRYRPDLTDLILSPGWFAIEDEHLQNRGSLKQVIQTGNMCQLDEYIRDDCFEVLFASQNDMQKKSENLEGQNENVRKHQTDTSPRNAVTDTAPEQSDVQDEDVDEEIRALEQLLMCKVCLDKDSCIVFFPCRHMATCESCEQFLQRCPVCRSEINEAVKINEE